MSDEEIVEENIDAELSAALGEEPPADPPVEPPADEPPTDPPVDPAPPIEPVIEPLAAPENWSEEDRTSFATLHELGEQGVKAQDFLLNRHKSMEGDYTKKTMEAADFHRDWEPVQQIFAPHMDALRANNMTPADQIQRWADIEGRFQIDPVGTVGEMLQGVGIDIRDLPVEGQDGYKDPAFGQLEHELQALKNSITQRDQQEIDARVTQTEQEIQAFVDEKTEAGEPAHPYFDEVFEDLTRLAHAEREAGREPKLGELYEKAVWMNPSIREQMLEAQRKAAEANQLDEARQKSAQARKAGEGITGAPDGPTGEDLSIEDELRVNMG